MQDNRVRNAAKAFTQILRRYINSHSEEFKFIAPEDIQVGYGSRKGYYCFIDKGCLDAMDRDFNEWFADISETLKTNDVNLRLSDEGYVYFLITDEVWLDINNYDKASIEDICTEAAATLSIIDDAVLDGTIDVDGDNTYYD